MKLFEEGGSARKLLLFMLLSLLLLLGFRQEGNTCGPEIGTVPIDVEALAGGASIPVQFPLSEFAIGYFNVADQSGVFSGLHHAAEDYHLPPGTPVFSIAAGEISFSGRMPGYGWLIIIDHPQVNVYSLYGHLSPSRWTRGKGPVEKGELIAYLGDSTENGSSDRYGEMAPHLHFGIRTGQRLDYPRYGDARWQAGWTGACPDSLGWLHPSQFLVDYAEGTYRPSNDLLSITIMTYLSYALGGLWLIGLGAILVLSALMRRELDRRGVASAGLPWRILPWLVVGRYRRSMLQETGRSGALYYPFWFAVLLSTLIALALIILVKIVL